MTHSSRSHDTLGALVRLFFSRFFDREALSPQGDSTANVVQTLGVLATPGGFLSLLLYFSAQMISGWQLAEVRCLFLSLSMALTGFVVVFEWDALFPDRRDYQVLLPLPLPMWKIFAAKVVAFVWFLGLFLAALNGIVALEWPFVFDNGGALAVIATHVAILLAAGAFTAFAAASVQGLLLVFVPARYFRPVATAAQTVLLTFFVMWFCLSPLLAGALPSALREHEVLAVYVPPYWFTGLYEWLRPAASDPALRGLSRLAAWAMGAAAAVFALTHLPLYRQHSRKLVETPPSDPAGPGRLRVGWANALDEMLLKSPVQIAVFHFIGQTIGRSMKHRLFLAVYAGFGIALTIINVAPSLAAHSGPDHATLLEIPLTLSFVLVTGLRAVFSFPSELDANWAFPMTGTSQARESSIAARKWMIVCAVVPLFALLGTGELQFLPWTDVAFQMAYGVTMSLLLMEAMLVNFPRIPFACGYFPGRTNLVLVLAAYVGALILYGGPIMTDLEARLMKNPVEAAEFFATAWAVWIGIWRWRAVSGIDGELDYRGDGDPVIRTLGITSE